MEKLLITPQEVVRIAFRQAEAVSETLIGETAILTAQEKFIRPALNGLFDKMVGGAYPELLEDYVKAPLALYVKLLVMPAIAVQTGAMGVVQAKAANFQSAAVSAQAKAEKQIRRDALSLIRKAIAHIESAPERFPEYDPRKNILNHITLNGGLILPK